VRCSRCGSDLPAEAGYCRGCGAILRGSAATAALLDGVAPSARDGAPSPPAALADGDSLQARPEPSRLEWAVVAAAISVLVSLALNWYEATVLVRGSRETVTRHLLSGNAGIQRWLVPVCAVLVVGEVMANRVWCRQSRRQWRPHRGVLMLLCVVQLVLVASCMASSPLSPDLLANIGISVNVGPGSWVALVGAVVGVGAAFGRMFSGGPQLGRSMSRS
jgi:hypothetical protein